MLLRVKEIHCNTGGVAHGGLLMVRTGAVTCLAGAETALSPCRAVAQLATDARDVLDPRRFDGGGGGVCWCRR